MNPLLILIVIIMTIFTLYHFWNDIRDTWNTGGKFGEGMANKQANAGKTGNPIQCSNDTTPITNVVECKKAVLELGGFKDIVNKHISDKHPSGCLYSGRDVHFNSNNF